MEPPQRPIREHVLSPSGQGVLESPSGVGWGHNAVCGDHLELQIAVEGERVSALCYRLEGCRAVGATASLVAEEALGQATAALEALDVAELVARAGGLPPTKGHAPRLVQRALREALADHRSRCHP